MAQTLVVDGRGRIKPPCSPTETYSAIVYFFTQHLPPNLDEQLSDELRERWEGLEVTRRIVRLFGWITPDFANV